MSYTRTMCHFFQLVVHSPHALGLVGLVLNTAGAFLLIPFPPELKGYRADGFIATIVLPATGFVLQFFDLVYVPQRLVPQLASRAFGKSRGRVILKPIRRPFYECAL